MVFLLPFCSISIYSSAFQNITLFDLFNQNPFIFICFYESLIYFFLGSSAADLSKTWKHSPNSNFNPVYSLSQLKERCMDLIKSPSLQPIFKGMSDLLPISHYGDWLSFSQARYGDWLFSEGTSLYESLCHGVCVCVCVCVRVCVCVCVYMYVTNFRQCTILNLVSNKFLARATKLIKKLRYQELLD